MDERRVTTGGRMRRGREVEEKTKKMDEEGIHRMKMPMHVHIHTHTPENSPVTHQKVITYPRTQSHYQRTTSIYHVFRRLCCPDGAATASQTYKDSQITEVNGHVSNKNDTPFSVYRPLHPEREGEERP